MSIQKMDEAIAASYLGQGDRKWWPFWMREFAKATGQPNAIQITISVDSVITFLRALRDSGRPAFDRLQVVRSLIFYQKEVLHASDPDLTGIRAELAMLSRDEPSAARPQIRNPNPEIRTKDGRQDARKTHSCWKERI